MRGSAPVVKELVLAGGGHSHVAVLRRFGMRPVPGVRLTLICRDVHTPYSGMLPGHVAGHYAFDEAHIDLGALARFAGARLFRSEVTGLDLAARRVLCADRPSVAYDLLSLNTGAAPHMDDVPGAAEAATPVKPIAGFLARWSALAERAAAGPGALRIAVVGAGAGGVEILLAVRYRLRGLGAEAAFHLFDEAPDILPGHGAAARRAFRRILAERGVGLHLGSPVVEAGPGRLRTAAGAETEVDEILWATRAGAPAWPAAAGLAVDGDGFVAVGDTLQSVSHPDVFAAGDLAHMVDHPRPKSGVFAVRQGPPLARNLRRALLGRPLRPFAPQKRFLSLISTGEKRAVASRGAWSVRGRAVWRWKDRIDRRFVARYAALPDMEAAPGPVLPEGLADARTMEEAAAASMRCGGCGAKIGQAALERALARVARPPQDGVLIGLDAPDDAAVLAPPPPGEALVQSVDWFPAPIDDPYLFGKIAANHGLGDLYAMGATPRTALALATLPFATEAGTEETLAQMMSGAVEVLDEAGAALVGGHSSEGAELAFGLAVSGTVAPDSALRKSGMAPGDALVLTKPVGTGTLLAADMRGKARGRWIAAALDSMVQSSRAAAACLRGHGARACTDVTGFGLLGHLAEMVRAAGEAGAPVSAELELDRIPLLDGAAETAGAGLLSSLHERNARLGREAEAAAAAREDTRFALLFDPQTAGGLLASLPADRAPACVAALRRAGYAGAAAIGRVRPAGAHRAPVAVRTGPRGPAADS